VKRDAGWLAGIHGTCFSQPRPWTAAEFDTLLCAPGAALISKSQGFVLARVAADEAEVLTIAVLPRARQIGIGRALMAELEADLRHRGVEFLHLEVSDANTPALALYYSRRFTESGRRSGYYPALDAISQDALILSKTLK